MAIRKRPAALSEAELEAAVEEFGSGADKRPVHPSVAAAEEAPQVTAPIAPVRPAKPALAKPAPVQSMSAPGPKVKPIPIRFTEEGKRLLERVALQQGRSQNNLVLHILIPALRALDAEGQ